METKSALGFGWRETLVKILTPVSFIGLTIANWHYQVIEAGFIAFVASCAISFGLREQFFSRTAARNAGAAWGFQGCVQCMTTGPTTFAMIANIAMSVGGHSCRQEKMTVLSSVETR